MPYRRLPKTDAARLKALKTLLDNNDIYIVRNRFIDWKSLNKAQPIYDKLLTAHEQYKVSWQAQTRHSAKIAKLQHNAGMYVSHFLQVLMMAVERGEIKKTLLGLYGLEAGTTALPNLNSADAILEWGKRVVCGEKTRIRQGGRPIYNPTVGMVGTHLDIFREAVEQQRLMVSRTDRAMQEIRQIRPEADELLLDLWNQIELHYQQEPPEVRFKECRKFGIVYYYRRHEERIY